ncbi:polysaccharide pyruvyl transferase family protein [Spongiibacter taiwanensis]|uniref:polysaccharide pyruvyl transferase family protein n=1 Tax=Spongiibacter taiwanensis TaxID=1748242 RepID=UPI0020360BFB|nr:polysaccharide pyruvyl transferase family protein [Spongiibacter taiwanensis]USA44816.1 polysaccharide pyruvyl transferase family protein [Spongiibacter taiwanensis]
MKINLYWWSPIKLKSGNHENYGDLIGPYLSEKISGRKVRWHPAKNRKFLFNKKVYVTVGSILNQVKRNWVVWGSGIISEEDVVEKGVFLAVRGPRSRNHLLSLGYEVPEIFGDPALLLPNFISAPEKGEKYEIGIIPHYVDFELVKAKISSPSIKIINLQTHDIEKTTLEIASCKKIISSSLHGIIVAHAYNIPSAWIKFSDNLYGDDSKFFDYFESVGIEISTPEIFSEKISIANAASILRKHSTLPERKKIERLQEDLKKSCPFKFKNQK